MQAQGQVVLSRATPCPPKKPSLNKVDWGGAVAYLHRLAGRRENGFIISGSSRWDRRKTERLARVNVTVESLAPCKKLMRVEVAATEVDEMFATVLKEYLKFAELPGFRPGKAPRDMVAKRFDKGITEEVRKRLIPKAYQDAVKEQKLDVIGNPDMEEIQFGRGQAMQLAFTVETAPEFELPEYKGLVAKRETTTVTDEDVQKALTMLRERGVTYNTVERTVVVGDIVVVNYTGTSDGKPLTEFAPAAQGLTESKEFWIDTGANNFIPGFVEQLVGAAAKEKRTVNIEFPAEFVAPQLVGLKAVYEVEVVEVKEKVVPALDEAFAKSLEAESIEKLTEGVRKDLENELTFKKNREVRNQLVSQLIQKVDFDLPESAVEIETRNAVYNIVNENQRRGVGKDIIEQQKDAIYSAANGSAKVRVKTNFLLRKIAEKQDIKVSQEEVAARIQYLAGAYNIPLEQFVKDLKERNGVMEIYDQVAFGKVLDFIQENAVIEDVPPGSLAPQPADQPAAS